MLAEEYVGGHYAWGILMYLINLFSEERLQTIMSYPEMTAFAFYLQYHKNGSPFFWLHYRDLNRSRRFYQQILLNPEKYTNYPYGFIR